MEVNKCVICSSSLEEFLYNGKVDVDMVKIFYDILIHRSSRNILPSVNSDNFWSSIFKFSYFCTSCERKVLSIVDLSSDLMSIQTTFKRLVDQMKMKIIKSTSTFNCEKRNISKIVAKSNIKNFGPVTLSNKIDCFRSLAVIDFNPDVTIRKSEWPTEPLSEDMVHMTKVKFSYFWKMKLKISSSKPKKSSKKTLFRDSFTEREIVHVNGLSKELLTLTMDELDAKFFYNNEKYKCKACRRIIKTKRCAINHYVAVHRKIKKWKCGYCGDGYYDRTKCGAHILRDHEDEKETRLTEVIEVIKPIKCVKCIICYTEFVPSAQQETQRAIFFDYCDAMNINYRHPYFQWNSHSVNDIPVFCDMCYGSVVTLCDLDNKRKEMLKSNNKIILQIKTDIIMSMMSQNEHQQLYSCTTIYAPWEFNSKHVVDKIDYIRRAAIQELNPDLRLFKIGNYQRIVLHRNSSIRKERPWRKNSLLSLLANGECVNLNPGLAETRLSLTDEETEFYLEFDPETQKYKCRECGIFLSRKYSAEDHVNKYHKQLKMFKCKYCGQQYYLKQDCAYHIVNSHISERKTDKIIAAPLPKLKLSTPDGIIDLGKEAAPTLKTDDIKRLPNGRGFMCMLCSLITKNRHSIIKHAKSVHYNMARFQCEFCGFKQLSRCQISYHIQKVHCDEVKRRNIVFESMPAHVSKRLKKLHSKWSRRPIDMTGINLVERKFSDADVEEYFIVSGVGFTCKECGKTYTARLSMVYHVESIHLGIRTCECAICGKRFFKISTCKRHYVRKHSKTTSDNTTDVLISANDLTSVHDSSHNAPCDSSDGLNNNLMTNTDLRKIESSCNFETEKLQSLSVWNTPYSEIDNVNKIITEDDCVADLDETNANFVKLEASGNSNWENETEGHLIQMENNDTWPSGTSDDIEKNVFPSEYNETNDFTYYETLTLEQEPEAQDITNCLNDPLESEGEKNSPTVNNKLKKTASSAIDRTPYIYTLIKEGDVIILPDVEMSDVYKYFEKIGKTKYKCNKCSRILTTDIKAKRHAIDRHCWVKRYQCSKCLKVYGAKYVCAIHFVTKHTRIKLYQCHICENAFGSNTSLKYHIMTHLNKNFPCTLCPLKLATSEKLKKHYNNVHKSVLQQAAE